ncbi:MAG: zinc ribbon domain-containing protein [Chloroflexota bacterium]
MNKINWSAVTVLGLAALLIVLITTGLLGGGWGMMGPGMMGGWGFAPFGWLGMAFMWLIPIGLIVLTVLGVAWLVRAAGSGGSPADPAGTCPSCGRKVQADWRNCPYCGAALT